MKKFILGFIVGGIICATITGFAVEYAITANPYPVKVNGVETAIEGYNINDNTYFKLRDVANAVGGFKVDFVDGTITVDIDGAVNPEPAVVPTIKPLSEIPPQATELNPVFSVNVPHENGLTSDGIPIKVSDKGEKYISALDIDKVYKYSEYGYTFGETSLYDKDFNTVIKNIPRVETGTTYEHYEAILKPFFIEHCR